VRYIETRFLQETGFLGCKIGSGARSELNRKYFQKAISNSASIKSENLISGGDVEWALPLRS
jgi:hypothetical protein